MLLNKQLLSSFITRRTKAVAIGTVWAGTDDTSATTRSPDRKPAETSKSESEAPASLGGNPAFTIQSKKENYLKITSVEHLTCSARQLMSPEIEAFSWPNEDPSLRPSITCTAPVGSRHLSFWILRYVRTEKKIKSTNEAHFPTGSALIYNTERTHYSS